MPAHLAPSPSHDHSLTVIDYQLSLPEGRYTFDVARFYNAGRDLDLALDSLLGRTGFTVSISRLTVLDGNFFHFLRLEKGKRTYFQITRGTLSRGIVSPTCAKILRMLPELKRVRTERLRFDPLTRCFKTVKI